MPAAKVPEGCYLANQSATQFEFFDEVGLVRVESLHPGSLIRARLARSGSHLDELLARGRHRAWGPGNVDFSYSPPRQGRGRPWRGRNADFRQFAASLVEAECWAGKL